MAGERDHTLFDFLDEGAVTSLRAQAEADAREVCVLRERGLRAQASLEERLLCLEQAIRAALEGAGMLPGRDGEEEEEEEGGEEVEEEGEEERVEATWLWRVLAQNVRDQARAMAEMKAALVRAASAYARWRGEGGGKGADAASEGGAKDGKALGPCSPAKEEQELLRVLQSGMPRMRAWRRQMEEEVPALLHALRCALRELVAGEMAEAARESHGLVEGLEEDQARLTSLRAEAQSSAREVESLAAFYSRFALAYAQLRPELERRRRVLRETAEVVKEVEAGLRSREEEEAAARERFWEAHGRYLPQSLCPVVREPAESFRVVPSVEEARRRLSVLEAREEEGGGRGAEEGYGEGMWDARAGRKGGKAV